MYVKLEVNLHGLPVGLVESVRQRVEDILKKEFDPEYKSDLEVEVVEHTTPLDAPRKPVVNTDEAY
jgi:hypothetical protein